MNNMDTSDVDCYDENFVDKADLRRELRDIADEVFDYLVDRHPPGHIVHLSTIAKDLRPNDKRFFSVINDALTLCNYRFEPHCDGMSIQYRIKHGHDPRNPDRNDYKSMVRKLMQ